MSLRNMMLHFFWIMYNMYEADHGADIELRKRLDYKYEAILQ